MGGGGGDWVSLTQGENYQVDVEGVVHVARQILGVQLDGLFRGSAKPELGLEFWVEMIGKLVLYSLHHFPAEVKVWNSCPSEDRNNKRSSTLPLEARSRTDHSGDDITVKLLR